MKLILTKQLLQKLIIPYILFQNLICNISSYSFNPDYLNINTECKSDVIQQSPIDVNTESSVYYEEKMFRIANTNTTISTESKWLALPPEKAIGFRGKFGNVTLIKDWSAFLFTLESVFIRSNSAHKVNGKYYDAEIQLVGSLNETYKTETRYIFPTAKKLVYSVFLIAEEDEKIPQTKILDYMNLEGYYQYLHPELFPVKPIQSQETVTTTTTETTTSEEPVYYEVNLNPKRDIKVGHLIKHSNQLLYEGRLDYNNCEKAWYVIDPQYQVITKKELEMIKKSLIKVGLTANTNGNNVREIQNIDSSTVIYRNVKNVTELIQSASSFQYTKSQNLSFNIYIISSLIFIFTVLMF